MAHIPAERCLSIIQLLAEGADEMPLGEIAEKLALPKSGVHRLLATLMDQGWVEKDPQTSFYRLTMRLAVLGQRFYEATGIPDVCQPVLDKLADASREFVRLAVVDEDTLVWVAHAQGAKHGLIYQPSLATNTVPLFATASGKSWLATLGADVAIRVALKSQGFDKADEYGPNVIRSVDALIRELDATSKRGYGIAVNEAEPGVTALASTVRSGHEGSVVGTVSIAGPSLRMTNPRIKDLAPSLLIAASELSAIWPLRRLGDRKRNRDLRSKTEAA